VPVEAYYRSRRPEVNLAPPDSRRLDDRPPLVDLGLVEDAERLWKLASLRRAKEGRASAATHPVGFFNRPFGLRFGGYLRRRAAQPHVPIRFSPPDPISVVLGADRGVMHVNHAALAIAAREDGISFDRKGMLRTGDRTAEQEVARQVADVASGGAGGIVRAKRRDDRQPYALLVAPLPSTRAVATNGRSGPNGILILIHDPDLQASDMTEAIATIFGMPVGAARLVSALMQGEDAKTYARRNGVTYDTIRYHLKSAFA
jgi:hypothetical protein